MNATETLNGHCGSVLHPELCKCADKANAEQERRAKVRVSPETLQGNLLKIATQQREIQRLNSLLAAERQRSNELTNRWAQVRAECGAPSDDSVVEVLGRIRQQRMTANS